MGGIQAFVKGNTKKLAEQDESKLLASGIPYTIIRAGKLQDAPGGQQGFCFDEVTVVPNFIVSIIDAILGMVDLLSIAVEMKGE